MRGPGLAAIADHPVTRGEFQLLSNRCGVIEMRNTRTSKVVRTLVALAIGSLLATAQISDIQAVSGAGAVGRKAPAQSAESLERQPARQSSEGSAAQIFTVTSAGDEPDVAPGDSACVVQGGGCTLRAAITEANQHPGPDNIAFSIAGPGIHTVMLGSSLPPLSDGAGGTTIDGYTQPGSTPNSLQLASNASIRIAIRSASETVGWSALTITSGHNMIRGLSLHHNWRSLSLLGPNAAYNTVVGNFIGTNPEGLYRSLTWNHANGGIYLNGGAHHNDIGRPGVEHRNVIAGNPASGVYHVGQGTSFNSTRNNIVGLAPSGLARLKNILEGVDFNTGSTDNIVGGFEPSERNVISGNAGSGVEVSHGTSVLRTSIIGNLIGTDVTGSSAPSYAINGGWGIAIEDGVADTLISTNVVGNATHGGIAINGYTQGTTRATVVRDNLIGVSLTGAAIPNGNFGVKVSLDANTTQIGPGNVIANNPYGIVVGDQRNYATTITRNSIYGNTILGINLGPGSGVTANDFGDTDAGANTSLNFPALSSATPAVVRGATCAGCTVEVFAADGGLKDHGEGRAFVGSAVAASDGGFSVNVAGVTVGQYVTATATDGVGNTSEFALNVPVTSASSPVGMLVASDSFSSSATDRWNAADQGGFWALSGSASDFDVANGRGTIRVSSAGQTRAASLLSVSIRDVNIHARVRTDKLPTGGSQNAWLVARQVELGTEYRVRLRMDPSGRIYLCAARTIDTVETYLSPEHLVQGLTPVAGSYIKVRAQIVGVNPVQIRVKAWANGKPEPSGWTYSVSDNSGALHRPGAAGVRAHVQGTSTNVPITFGFDDFKVKSAAGW